MIENTTNLANATVSVSERILEICFGILFDHLQVLLGLLLSIILGGSALILRKRAAKKQIRKLLSKFISLEQNSSKRIKLDGFYQKKIEEIGNDLKDTLKEVDKRFMLFGGDFLTNARDITDKIITLSKRRNIDTKGYDTLMAPVEEDRIKLREDAGNELVDKAKELSKVLKRIWT